MMGRYHLVYANPNEKLEQDKKKKAGLITTLEKGKTERWSSVASSATFAGSFGHFNPGIPRKRAGSASFRYKTQTPKP
jgi:hypothetical protein